MNRLFFLFLMLYMTASSAFAQTEGDFTYLIRDGSAIITAYTGSAEELTLPDTLGGYPVTAINYCAFRNCASLTSVTIPSGVTAIGSRAFQNCPSLTQILIPDSVKRIDTHAFHGCAALRQITLPDHMDRIHNLAFYGCSAVRFCRPDSLTAATLTAMGLSFRDPDDPLLSLKVHTASDGTRTFTVVGCDASAVSVTIPPRVTAIERNAFHNCPRLAEVILPDSVERIDADAFSTCAGVTLIAPPGSAGQAFAEANGLPWQAP